MEKIITLNTSDWLTIIGILIAIIFGFLSYFKKGASPKNKINISQNSAPFSKGKQKQNVNINTDDR